ncbi:sodium:proton antiporter [Verticiella sediminum]|uniref:Sodium:proton antiporter n=1 Tax=Verticiella sediminum TaxID=1247510 RepID=A0A556AWI2_9BURK|nr:sodium:proton antiporter [Verticiella sediminum]TSH97299.1 sodium:proton antiporter [Verticiella sediminum]
MSLLALIGTLITLVAALGYLNHRFIGLPDATGIAAIGLAASLLMGVFGQGTQLLAAAQELFGDVDFASLLLHGILGMLLFAGGLHASVAAIAREKWLVLILSTVGVLVSTVAVGFGFYAVTWVVGMPLPLLHCLVFGALISPTDPIAVLGVLRKVGVPASLEARITGESLFNDGMGVVLFLTLLGIAVGGAVPTLGDLGLLLVREMLGGAVFGIGVGLLGLYMIRTANSDAIATLVSLAMATGGYAAAEALGVSAPIAVVFMGLLVGGRGESPRVAEHSSQRRLFTTWEVIDELLNLMLFGLIGLEIITLQTSASGLLLSVLAIPVVLLARYVSVVLPVMAAPRLREWGRGVSFVMTWGGLRGGVSIALALSLASTLPDSHVLIAATYGVVIFSILVQGLTLRRVISRALPAALLAHREAQAEENAAPDPSPGQADPSDAGQAAISASNRS